MTFPIRIDFAITEDTYPNLLDFLQFHAINDDERPNIGVTIGWVTTPEQATEFAAAEPRKPEASPSTYLDFEVKASNAPIDERLTESDLRYFQHTLLVLQRRVREGCLWMSGQRRGVSQGTVWLARCVAGHHLAIAATPPARTAPAAKAHAPLGTPGAG